MSTLMAAFIATLLQLSQPSAVQYDRQLDVSNTMCLTEAIYHEARGEPDGGIGIAYVALNRSVLNKKSLCQLIHAKSQFSYYNPNHPKSIKEMDAWKYSAYIAVYTQLGLLPNPIGNATSYNEFKVNAWLDDMVYTRKRGNLYFYELKNINHQEPIFKTITLHWYTTARPIVYDSDRDNKRLILPQIQSPMIGEVENEEAINVVLHQNQEPKVVHHVPYVTVAISPSVPFPQRPSLSHAQVVALASALKPTPPTPSPIVVAAYHQGSKPVIHRRGHTKRTR